MILQPSQRCFQKNRVYEEKLSLINILTCLICTNKANQAHICPNCSKFYCQTCIKDWLLNTGKQCPNCRKQIEVTSLVNCNKLSQDLSGALEALIQFQFPTESACQIHSLGLSYYCHNCQCPLCSDCIVLSQEHHGHRFIKINKMKVAYNQNVLRLLSKIRNKKKQLQKEREEFLGTRSADSMNEKIDILHNYLGKIKDTYHRKTVYQLQKSRDQLVTEKFALAATNKQYSFLLTSIKEMSKVDLMRKTHEQLQGALGQMIMSLDSTKKKMKSLQSVMKYMKSIITPENQQKILVFENFNSYLQKKESIIYSEVFSDGLNQWRLKIYPNGVSNAELTRRESGQISPRCFSQTSKDQYVSIYLELVSGIRPFNQFKHKIQLLHPSDMNKNISRIYHFEFETGSCWGYYHFTKISTLYDEGFIDPRKNSLKLQIYLGYPSYFYACLDKDPIIDAKKMKVKQNKLKIYALKQKLGISTDQIDQASSQILQTRKDEQPEQQIDVQNLNYTDFRVERIQVENKCGEEYDHQSKELSKIFKRISKFQSKSLLLF